MHIFPWRSHYDRENLAIKSPLLSVYDFFPKKYFFLLGFPYNEYRQYLIWRERLSSFHALLDPFVILFSASGGFTNFQTLIKMETNQEICQETHKLCFILDQLSIVSLSDFTSFIGCTRQLSRQALVYHWTTTVTATGPHTSADVPVRTLTTGHKHLNSPDTSAANCYRYVSLSGVLISDIGFADIEIPETIFTIWKIS